jgi:hypothetical protein
LASKAIKLLSCPAISTSRKRAYAHALHAALGPRGIQVGHVAIGAWIGKQPGATPEAIAPLYWRLHTQQDEVEKVFFLETTNEPENDQARLL